MNRTPRLLVLALTLVIVVPASAREEGATASSLGVADAVRSSAVGSSALYFNPAGMHQFLQYAIDTGYTFMSPIDGHVFNASLVDSATNQSIAAGFGYTYILGNELGGTEVERSGSVIRAGLASGYRGQTVSAHAGVGVRYLDLTIGNGGSATGFTLDAGALLVVNGMFRFAVVGHNLIETSLAETPRRLGLGASILYYSLLLSFDSVLDWEGSEELQAQYSVGLEYAIQNVIPLRLGYQQDEITGQRHITGGVGYVSKVVAVDFGFSQNIEDKTDNIFSLNVRAFVP